MLSESKQLVNVGRYRPPAFQPLFGSQGHDQPHTLPVSATYNLSIELKFCLFSEEQNFAIPRLNDAFVGTSRRGEV